MQHDRARAHRERLRDRIRHLRFRFYGDALRAEGARPGGEIGVGEARAGHEGAARIAHVAVHADGAVHAVVGDHGDRAGAVLAGGGELVAHHQRAAVAHEGHHLRARPADGGGDRHRHARAHRAHHRGQEHLPLPEADMAVQEGGEIAGVRGDGGVRGEMLADLGDDGGEVHPVLARLPGPFQQAAVGAVQPVDPAAPALAVSGCGPGEQRLHHLVRARGDAERRAPHAADLVRVRPDVDQRQLRLRRGREGVGLAHAVGQPLAERDHQVRPLHLVEQLLRHPDAHIAAMVRVVVIEELRPAVGRHDRQHPAFREAHKVAEQRRVAHRICHRAAAGQQQRPLGRLDHGDQRIDILRPGGGNRARARRRERRVRLLVENVLRQDDRHRPRRAGFGEMEGARHRFGGLLRLVDLDHVLGDVGEQAGIVLLLEREAAHVAPLDLADQHHQRRRVVEGGVHGDQPVGEAGAARDHGDARPVAHAPVGGGHEARAGLVPADRDLDRVALDHGAGEADIALAGHAINAVHIVRLQTFHQQAGDGSVLRHGLGSPLLRNSGRDPSRLRPACKCGGLRGRQGVSTRCGNA